MTAAQTVPPIITLTTDFGTLDHYAGTMKGVITSICPDARIIDITHDIPHFNIWSGAYAISQAAPFFPEQTIHVVVVDPGVGTARRAIACSFGGQVFIAPDNGVLSLVIGDNAPYSARELKNPEIWVTSVSETFHGRDLFAPAAARLACGLLKWDDVGPELNGIVRLPNTQAVEERPRIWQGRVLSIDHFGNIITNFQTRVIPLQAELFHISAGDHTVKRLRRTFGEATRGELFVYAGSSGYYEIGINRESAAKILGVAPGDAVALHIDL